MSFMDDLRKNTKFTFYPGKGKALAFFRIVYHRATIPGFSIGTGTDGKPFIGVPIYHGKGNSKNFSFEDWLDKQTFRKLAMEKYEEWKKEKEEIGNS